MSYIAHPATKLAARGYFADFNLSLIWSGPGKIAHLFAFTSALIPFYAFSEAYRAGKKSRTNAENHFFLDLPSILPDLSCY